MTRRRITKGLRDRVYKRDAGVCHLCRHRIDQHKHSWHVEHVIPLWSTRDPAERAKLDVEANMAPAHNFCHQLKTALESGLRAKSDRVHDRHIGAHRSKRPIKGWRKFDGTPVRNPKLRRLS